ncbi:MAG: hypothetical protein AVDCRST_MAG49-1732 [uncultured Thermomicrobiales bacterium]|uniref:Uncharacterized protein n=1 Tax=uncultured Thermomicrobiales bacterium TaxID=1645740 RepID=A0A6J4UHQ9_9BACT|nr:MAG: hypothetical protein AVDCRST_MAG49-1732 [uncultured Thermomicrobiales bacterium]
MAPPERRPGYAHLPPVAAAAKVGATAETGPVGPRAGSWNDSGRRQLWLDHGRPARPERGQHG